MRTHTRIIDGVERTFTLLCGIPGLVKVYSMSGSDRPWLEIKKRRFTLQDGPNEIVLRFVNLRYQPESEKQKIEQEFRKLCEVYL